MRDQHPAAGAAESFMIYYNVKPSEDRADSKASMPECKNVKKKIAAPPSRECEYNE